MKLKTKNQEYPIPVTVRESMDLVFVIMQGWLEDATDDVEDVDKALDILALFIEKHLEKEGL